MVSSCGKGFIEQESSVFSAVYCGSDKEELTQTQSCHKYQSTQKQEGSSYPVQPPHSSGSKPKVSASQFLFVVRTFIWDENHDGNFDKVNDEHNDLALKEERVKREEEEGEDQLIEKFISYSPSWKPMNNGRELNKDTIHNGGAPFRGRRYRRRNVKEDNTILLQLRSRDEEVYVSSRDDRNDHTTVTAPLPVCSAKLSTVGPDFSPAHRSTILFLLRQ
eukprot:scaffold1347_cov92-Skeletonema_marinoi.AAC.1